MTETRDLRSPEHRVLVRVLHPRRNYPTVLVFVEGVVVFEDTVYRTDATPAAEALVARADDIAAAYSPRDRCQEITYETTRDL